MKTATSNRQLKIETPLMVFAYRLFARWMKAKFLLLTTVGRKSRRRRTVPLVYMPMESGFAVIAANVGLDVHPGWFLNLKANPQVQIQVGREKIAVLAREVNAEMRENLWSAWIKSNPGYADFQAKTTRQFPMVVLIPMKSS